MLAGRARVSPEPSQPRPSMSDQQLFSIGEVASMIGVSPHTIRAWERRHQLLTPQRTPRRQRRYTADDVALLLQVKHAVTAHGLSLKVAVRSAHGDLSVPALDALPAPRGPDGLDARPTPDAGAAHAAWRSAVDLLPQMIAIIDLGGRVLDGNRAAATVLGLPRDQLVGLPLATLLARVSPGTDVSGRLQRAFVQPTGFELRLRTPAGSGPWWFDCRPFTHERELRVAVFGRSGDG